MTRLSVRAELAAAVRVINVEFGKLSPTQQSEVEIVTDDLDAALVSDDRDQALAEIARWRNAQLKAILAVAR